MDKILQFFIAYDPLVIENILYSVLMLFVYIFICLVLPSLFLSDVLKHKSFAFKFVFYQIISNVYINVFGYALAYLKLFNTVSVWVCMIVIPVLIKLFINRKKLPHKIRELNNFSSDFLLGFYGTRLLVKNTIKALKQKIIAGYNKFIKGNWLEILLLGFVLFCGFMFFGSVKFTLEGYRYTAADEEVHLFWVKSLLSGDPFPKGMYPHGLHFLSATLVSFFGIGAIEGFLALAPGFFVMLMATFYFILRELFKTKFPIIIAIGIYIISDILVMYSYDRFQRTLPMEFGIIAIIGAIYAFICYARQSDKLSLVLAVCSITLTGFIHFFDSIWLVFLCFPFAMVFFKTYFQKRLIKKFIIGGLISIAMVILPFVVGLSLGYPFEQSMNWAMEMMGLVEEESEDNADLRTTQDEEVKEDEIVDEIVELSFEERIQVIYKVAAGLYNKAIFFNVIFFISTSMLLYGLITLIFVKKMKDKSMMYILFSLIWFMSVFVFLFEELGLPTILIKPRCAPITAFFSIPIFIFPFLLLADIIKFIFKDKLIKVREVSSFCIGLACIAFMFSSGNIKEERYYSSTLTEMDAQIAKYLINEETPFDWTLVTSTTSITLLMGSGYHYEIIDLIENIEEGKDVYIPTEDVYVVVEKDAKGWNYAIYVGQEHRLPEPKMISAEYALDDSLFSAEYDDVDRSDVYKDYRPQLMSRLYYWAQEIERCYPEQISVFYEDDKSIIYKIEQDPYFLLNLSVDYLADLEKTDNSQN